MTKRRYETIWWFGSIVTLSIEDDDDTVDFKDPALQFAQEAPIISLWQSMQDNYKRAEEYYNWLEQFAGIRVVGGKYK